MSESGKLTQQGKTTGRKCRQTSNTKDYMNINKYKWKDHHKRQTSSRKKKPNLMDHIEYADIVRVKKMYDATDDK